MAATVQIQGICDPRFTAVRDAFAENFARRGDVGAAVCVYLERKPVVPLQVPGKTRLTFRQLFPTAAECRKIKNLAVGANEQNMDRLAAELAMMR